MAARLTAYVVVGIVAATLIAGLIVGAQRDDSDGPIDIIIHNAKVYTAGRWHDGRSCGHPRQPDSARRQRARGHTPPPPPDDDDRRKGAAVVPGLQRRAPAFHRRRGRPEASISPAPRRSTRSNRASGRGRGACRGPWVIGRGWYYEPFPGGMPTRQQLDALVSGSAGPDRQLRRAHGVGEHARPPARRDHQEDAEPAGGVIVKDSENWRADRRVEGSGNGARAATCRKTTRADRRPALRAAIGEAQRNGITSVQNASGHADDSSCMPRRGGTASSASACMRRCRHPAC